MTETTDTQIRLTATTARRRSVQQGRPRSGPRKSWCWPSTSPPSSRSLTTSEAWLSMPAAFGHLAIEPVGRIGDRDLPARDTTIDPGVSTVGHG